MASATVDHRHHHPNHLHLESIPVVDLRLLSQPELLSLSLCSSSPFPSNAETELFTPKIDRSVFNESAGSRKQTFFRLRFAAPRSHLHHHHSSPASKPFPSRSLRLDPEPLDEESSNILSLLKSLFNIDDSLTANTNENEPYDDKDLVPVQIEFSKGNPVLQNIPVGIVNSSVRKRKRGRPRKDEKDNWLIESESLVIEEYKETPAFDRVNETANAGIISSCSEGKRRRGRPRRDESQSRVIGSEEKKVERVALGIVEADRVNETANAGNISSCSEGKRRRGRPRREVSQSRVIGSEEKKVERVALGNVEADRLNEAANICSCSEGKRRRGRPRREESQSRVIGSEEKEVEREIERVALGNVEAILGIEEELRRRTEGMGTEAELLEFMGGLGGEWASKSQKKRIIDAGSFGSVLPKGWKLTLFVKKRAGHFWLACSRYISPNRQQFVSCKEVSSYLLSSGTLEDSSLATLSHTGCGIGSGVKPTTGNLPITSISSGHEKPAPLLRMGSPREVQRAETIKCHKCTMTFDLQDDFVCHLLSSHQGTAKISGHGASTNEEVIIKNGKYECQFCHELFEERNCYSSHLGIHMKNNMKKLEGSVAVLTMQNSIQPFNSPGNNEIRSGFPCSNANENALVKTYTDKFNHECNSLSHDEHDIKVNRNEETLADNNCDKQNKFCIITNNEGEVTDTAAAAEVNFCLGSKLLFTDDKKGISQSSDKTDVRFALNSMEEKKREMASKTSLLAPNAVGNLFSDENIEDRRFASFTKGIETDWKDKVTRDDPKARWANTHTGLDNNRFDVEQQNYSEGCSLILSSNRQRGNLVDYVKGASVRIDSVQERGSGCGLTSSKDDQTCVINNNLILVSTGTLDGPESIVVSESGNNDSTIGFQSNLRIKKPSQEDSESALLTLHGREQIFASDSNAFKVPSRSFEVSELDEARKSRGLMQGVDGCDSGLDANNLASVKHERSKDCLFVRSSYTKTFTGTLEEHKDKGYESSVNEQFAYQQNSNYETSTDKVSFITIEEPKHKVESSLFGNAHARLGTFALTGDGRESCSPLFPVNGEKYAGKNNIPTISSGPVHKPKQNKGAFEDLFCLSGREQTHVANNLNLVYAGTAHDGSRLEDFENARNNEIMIGFSNHARPTEDYMTGLTWKSGEGNVLLSGLADTSSQFLQSSGYYPTFDLMSHKGESEMFNISGKCSSVTGFDGLRSDSIENMEYNFLTAQPSSGSGNSKGESEMFNISGKCSSVTGFDGLRSDSIENMEYNFLTAQPSSHSGNSKGESEMFNISGKCSSVAGFEGLRSDSIENMEYNFLTAQPSSRSGNSKVPSNDSEMALKFDSSVCLGKEALPLLPKIASRHQVATLCSWCGNEFYHEAVDIGAQRSSMVMCANCRARFSRNHDFM